MYINTKNFGIPMWPIGIIVLFLFLSVLWKRKRNFSFLLFFSIFWVYLLYGFDKVFFPIDTSGSFVDQMRLHTPIMSRVNIVPFYFGQYGFTLEGLISVLYNIVLTIPFGLGLNFISRVKSKDFLIISLFLGVGIELIQLSISLLLRYPYRVVDINDSMSNALGVLIGYGLFRLFAWIYLWISQRLTLEHGGLSLYIYNIVNNAQSNK